MTPEERAEALVTWLEDFMDRDEHLMIGTRVKLQQRIAETIQCSNSTAVAEERAAAAQIADKHGDNIIATLIRARK